MTFSGPDSVVVIDDVILNCILRSTSSQSRFFQRIGKASEHVLIYTHVLTSTEFSNEDNIHHVANAVSMDSLINKHGWLREELQLLGHRSVQYVDCIDGTLLSKIISYGLCGAYFLHFCGGFHGAKNFYQWSTDLYSGQALHLSNSSLHHYCFGLQYYHHGRTPTYQEIKEVDGILEVSYEGRGTYKYSRSDPMSSSDLFTPHEKIADSSENWKPIQFSRELSTFISSHIMYVNRDDVFDFQPLPNKVASWLFGKPLLSLVTNKHFVGSTPDFDLISECSSGILKVRYLMMNNKTKWLVYRRDGACGLGFEGSMSRNETLDSFQVLIYSEVKKTLLSPNLRQPLPNKVVDWLGWKSLSLFSQPISKKHSQEDVVTSSISISEDECQIQSVNGTLYCYYCKPIVGGVIFYERLHQCTDIENRPLIYNVKLETWISPSFMEPINEQVVQWLKKFVQRHINTDGAVKMYRHQMF